VDAPKQDPYAPPGTLVSGAEPVLALRYVWAERSLLVVLAVLLVIVGSQLGIQLRAGAPPRMLAFVAVYELGIPAAALVLVLLGKHVGYLVACMAGSTFASLSPPILKTQPLWGVLIVALSAALWALAWFAARGRFGYLFKRPRQELRRSVLARRR
jgi:hypothetical protein